CYGDRNLYYYWGIDLGGDHRNGTDRHSDPRFANDHPPGHLPTSRNENTYLRCPKRSRGPRPVKCSKFYYRNQRIYLSRHALWTSGTRNLVLVHRPEHSTKGLRGHI